jgi:hypothetical protein
VAKGSDVGREFAQPAKDIPETLEACAGTSGNARNYGSVSYRCPRHTRHRSLNSSFRLGPFLGTPRQRSALNVTEQPEWSDYLLFFCFCRWAYGLHQHRVGISARHRSKKHVRAMLPIFAENNSVTIHLFNSACSRIAQGSVRHVRRFLKAMACSVSPNAPSGHYALSLFC